MSLDRLQKLEARFVEQISAAGTSAATESAATTAALTPQDAREILESMIGARQLDLAAHELRAQGHGHYTICSTGHEINALVGRLTTPQDPAIVHYRSAAFQLERARQVPGTTPLDDILLTLVASLNDPTSGGRHKVFGGKNLGIIPSTSTIASHLPRAVGIAFAIERRLHLDRSRSRVGAPIAICSFGDASLNHSTAIGAINTAAWGAHQNLPVPVLFVCEDNGLGISTRTPEGWVEARLRAQPAVRYFSAESWDLAVAYDAVQAAVNYVRSTRRPAALHLRCGRLLGHAGSDVDTTYRSNDEIDTAIARDPLVTTAQTLIRTGIATVADVLALHTRLRAEVLAGSARAVATPRLTSRAQVMEALTTPFTRESFAQHAAALSASLPAGPANAPGLTLAQGINQALTETLEGEPNALIFGEDVAKKGGVYGLTKGLFTKFGPSRVFNTLLDEQSILGLALGAATQDFLPIPEIQYLAYLHNAEDQLRGEAATMQFFSQRAFDNPMIVRLAGLAYQKGFGGHFHNDNSLSVLRDIPGLVVMVPARGDDAIELFRAARLLAVHERRVVVIVEPIALYHSKDLHDGDNCWLGTPGRSVAEWLQPRVYQPEATDLLIVTYGNGVWLSLRAAAQLEREQKIKVRVLDLRWIVPLPIEAVLQHVRAVPRVLVVDECRVSGNVSEALAAAILDAGIACRFRRINAADSLIPLGDAANLVLVSEAEIVAAGKAVALA